MITIGRLSLAFAASTVAPKFTKIPVCLTVKPRTPDLFPTLPPVRFEEVSFARSAALKHLPLRPRRSDGSIVCHPSKIVLE